MVSTTTYVSYEKVSGEQILFQPKGMEVQYVENETYERMKRHQAWVDKMNEMTRSNKEDYEYLNRQVAWKKAFKSAGIKLSKITKSTIKFRIRSKMRTFRICVNKNYKTGGMKPRNIQFIKYLDNGEYHYMRPIYYRGEIVMNHYSEDKRECYPETLDDVDYRCNIGFFVDDEDDEDFATVFISNEQIRRVDILLG